ncbi:hypothetical protein [Sphingomicrobium astaxanthinifaciens]|uniref:hypothetical protein n=1 Tax=Sphingomicrobium astaxanthinifaciens TaxID=1227949 RepID=UPI001FCB59D6|nr:hypothetical protein [Sphingomicrobium astaxanthinifaciens]MCJ7420753.1 hypothetical protein [Sphingomicrobium astaxanthinifaciens]
MPARFAQTVAIDWSGAKGERHKGIAVARKERGRAPALVRPGHVWSRAEVLDWLRREACRAPTLFGFDFSFAPPLLERGSYLPGADVPTSAKAFWAYVDAVCADPDLGAASFLEQLHREHFYFGKADGDKARFMWFREVEKRLNAAGGGKAATVYDAIGAAQVAKASFAGMRLLHRLVGQVPVWPFDPLPETGSVVVEIYGRLYLRRAGGRGTKLRSAAALDAALVALGSPPAGLDHDPSDHETDALVTAAGMAQVLATEAAPFAPPGLTPAIASAEGWTFGVV